MSGLAGAWSGGGGRPGSAAQAPSVNLLGGTTFAERMNGLGVSGAKVQASTSLALDRGGVQVGGSFGLSGLMTVAVLLLALLALDRYVLDVPGVGKGK